MSPSPLSTTTPAPAASRGHSLVEALAVLVLVATVLLVALPSLAEARRTASLRSLTGQISGLLARCRAEAVLHHLNTALVFELDTVWSCYMAVDGDGDGVRRDDLAAGRDRRVSAILRLDLDGCRPAILGGERIPDPSGSGWLGGNLDDPVRAGRGNMISFSPVGSATPASVYLSDGQSQMRVIRVFGATGRSRAMAWKRGWNRWKQSVW